ncbi:MAG: GDP-mannose 4,6-dehydratase, partial [Zetaproteobacteria bacterium]
MKRALICGVSGQDGAYLARLLLQKGYEVWGTSRDAEAASFSNLKKLGILDQVRRLSMVMTDFRSVLQAVVQADPDEVYNLAGQSSVGLSFAQPVETLQSHALGTLNLLEVVRFLKKPIRIYNASSGECFGDTGDVPANERTPFRPRSPYGVAKAAAHWEVVNYREAYGLFACNGILFNHESPLRQRRFVTRKIANGVAAIVRGEAKELVLGDLSVQRDWGWAEEYVQAMWLMLQQDDPDDYVVATGETYSLQDFVAEAFRYVGLDWKDYVRTDPSLYRPSDIRTSRADPSYAMRKLGWRAKLKMHDVVRRLV